MSLLFNPVGVFRGMRMKSENTLSEFLASLTDYTPTIPDELVEPYLAKSGFQYDDAVGCLDTRIRSFVASSMLLHLSCGLSVTLVDLDGDRDYHMPDELGGSGGMLRKTICWKCAKGLKMVIIEKKAELEAMRKEFTSQRHNLEAMMRKVMKQVVEDRDE
ncbi:putative transcription initiation factor TFIID, 23-30kDa subunit [Helianthus annuus]|uniref:Transcription initiation factor TFIID, 23-30kDa subunit n=1 Tax=Helianthus annuus TaxID=4232 RepID=A0A9K3E7Z9_HELAN|nr:putative transcription initiation factor TFIID, 23-30kDa subunit [Helianthus annuus]KAJ0839532.1 putative transcription initiation factor TFIID, 23-30kDa subunit [Helianthus annuus]